MLSDSLFEVYKLMREGYEVYCDKDTDYDKEICDETENILNRLNVLRHKLDAGDYYGSYRFNDYGAFAEYKKSYRLFRIQIIAEVENRYDETSLPVFTEYSSKWMWARQEIGKERYDELKDKYIEPYRKKYQQHFPKK